MNCRPGRASSRVAASRCGAWGTSHHNNRAQAGSSRQVRLPGLPADFPIAAGLEAIGSCEAMIARTPRLAISREDHDQTVFCIGWISFSRDGMEEESLHQLYRNIALVFRGKPFLRRQSLAPLLLLCPFYAPFMRCLAAAGYGFSGTGGVMDSICLVLLLACCMALTLGVLHLAEMSREARVGTGERELPIAPLQLAGPASMIFWSEGMWACFLSLRRGCEFKRPGCGPSSRRQPGGNLRSKPARFLNWPYRFFNAGIRRSVLSKYCVGLSE